MKISISRTMRAVNLRKDDERVEGFFPGNCAVRRNILDALNDIRKIRTWGADPKEVPL